jgi:hypothetical protein
MADVKLAYGSSAALTITLASLATDTSLLTGRESTAVDNSGSKYLDELISGNIRVGTSPTTGKVIEIWAYGSLSDSPTYPDVFDGTDSAETVTSAGVKNSALKLIHTIETEATSDRDYAFGPIGLAQFFGGTLPKFWGIFVTHNTAVNLNSTGGNHNITHTPVYQTVA